MGPLGLEPRTNGLKVRCSNQLSYGPGKIVPEGRAGATACGPLAGPHAINRVPERGLEPPPSYLDKNLNLARLPIPPLGRVRPPGGDR